MRNRWERNAGLRLDHILLSETLAAGLRDAGVDRWVRGEDNSSDHAPAWVEVDAGNGAGRSECVVAGRRQKR